MDNSQAPAGEATHITRTYTIRIATVDRLDTLADELNLWQSDLVDYLLASALQDVESGRKVVKTTPIKWGIVYENTTAN